MSNIIPFKFNASNIRVIESDSDIDIDPMFVAKDIAILLGYSNTNKAINDHCKGVTKRYLPTASGEQQISVIPERDVYRLIMRSKMPEAEKFEEWVVSEVLPSIRKTGGYKKDPGNMSRMDILKLAMQAEEEKQQLLAHIEEDKPKVEFHDTVVAAPDCISVAQTAKILGTGQRRLFDYLRKIHWVSRRNEPYQEKINTGYMNVKLGSFNHPDHGLKQSVTALITGKGLAKLKQLMQSDIAA